MRWTWLAIGITLLAPSCSFASTPGVETLRGIRSMTVVVALDQDLISAGLDSSAVLVDAQLALRKVGIRVVDENSVGAFALPELLLVTEALADKDHPQFACSINAMVIQMARLERDRTLGPAFVTTWNQGYTGIWGRYRVGDLRGHFHDLVDQFLNDYLSVNPKMAGGAR